MARTAPRTRTVEPTGEEILKEARAIREEYQRDPERTDDEKSPQAFYERVVERDDIREILRRLAKA